VIICSEDFPPWGEIEPPGDLVYEEMPKTPLTNDAIPSDIPTMEPVRPAEQPEDVSGDGYESTYEERLQQTPKDGDRGHWEGERGESEYIPTDEDIKDILKEHGVEGIVYKNGEPDFSPVADTTVEIDNMSDRRYGEGNNFEQADQACADKWNTEGRDGRTDWTARDVKEWREENGYTWHERNDKKTCDLVPAKINDYFGHLGGCAECAKAAKTANKEDVFDD
jgi:hypothetical protein